MKIQNTPNLQLSSKNQNTSNKNASNVAFGNGAAFTSALNFIQTNQAIGATLVDALFMCSPRTAVDFTRSADAGIETARREFSSNINDGLLGLYGAGAAYIFARSFNNKYNVKANEMFVDEDSLDIMTHVRNKNGDIRKPENLKAYLGEIIDGTSGFNPVKEGGQLNHGWAKFSSDADSKKAFIDKLVTEFNPSEATKPNEKETKAYLKALLVKATGAESQIKLENKLPTTVGGVITNAVRKAEVSADDFVDNLYKVSKSFMSKDVIDNSGKIKTEFIDGLKKVHTKTAVLGLAACMAIGAAVQPINIYLTKKKTGKEGFVGVEGREPDKSFGFKLLKVGAAAIAMVGSLAAITKNLKIGPKAILKEVKFKGLVPTLNQFKLVYGVTIVSRLLSARDKNELREASIKDSLGFANWLILGGFAANLTAIGMEKLARFKNNNVKFLMHDEVENGTKLPKWITGSILSREEALHDAFKKAKINVIEGGKALSFKEMLKKLPELEKTNPEAYKAINSKMKVLGLLQFVGYIWSGLALGVGVPKLNIAITNAIEKKNKASKPETTTDKPIDKTEKQDTDKAVA